MENRKWWIGKTKTIVMCDEDKTIIKCANSNQAKLVTTAPEMLYALKRAMVVINSHYPENLSCANCNRDMALIKDVIAKAEGK